MWATDVPYHRKLVSIIHSNQVSVNTLSLSVSGSLLAYRGACG